jgi:hypothetical protein
MSEQTLEEKIEKGMQEGKPPHWIDSSREQVVPVKAIKFEHLEGKEATYPSTYGWAGDGANDVRCLVANVLHKSIGDYTLDAKDTKLGRVLTNEETYAIGRMDRNMATKNDLEIIKNLAEKMGAIVRIV